MFKVSDEDAFVEVSLVSPIPAISLKLDHQKLIIRNKIKKILGMDVPSVGSTIEFSISKTESVFGKLVDPVFYDKEGRRQDV